MSNTDTKIKHLEFIQATINRMAGNSFLLKGWAVTLVGALLALSFKEMNWLYVLISLVVLTLFWALDSYYLEQERSFIKLYEHVIKNHGDTDFSMDTKPHRKEVKWHRCAFSHTVILFYGGMLLVHIVVLIIILNT